jgi:hypothetical protein
MISFKVCSSLFLYLTLTACSNTVPIEPTSSDTHYYNKDFTHTEFSPHHRSSVKKQTSSDQQLMLSLLNRPVPEDQRMMLDFAQKQLSYYPNNSLVGIQIRGNKHKENYQERVTSNYANIIEQDTNAVSISLMPK